MKQRLDKHIANYDKNKNVYEVIKPYLKDAISRAKKLKQYHESLGKILPSDENDYLRITAENIVKSNPYTNIIDLIEYMENLEQK